MKTVSPVLFSVLVVLAVLLFVFDLTTRPPSEDTIIASLKNNRDAYERLRDMLAADPNLLRVAEWGIETDKGFEKPPQGGYPAARYYEYVALLKRLKAKGASRSRGNIANPCVLIWASGFGGDTRHRSICWLSVAPDNLFESLKAFEASPKPRKPSFKKIDGSWYIWADW